MTRIGVLDLPAGISGDMFLGALVGAGASLERMEEAARALAGPEVRLRAERVRRAGMAGWKVDVLVRGEPVVEGGGPSPPETAPTHGPGRHAGEILRRVEEAPLPDGIRPQVTGVLRRLLEAEAAVHDAPLQSVHLHEVGTLDALADVAATAAGLQDLALKGLYHGPVALGGGTVRAAHGELPVPAPATLHLLRGRPCRSGPEGGELTTPTGAALLAELALPLPGGLAWIPERAGYGAGRADPAAFPNLARLTVGETAEREAPPVGEVAVLETSLDDATPEEVAQAVEGMHQAGALDAMVVPATMKHGRPGVLVRIVARTADAEALARRLLATTPSLGVRWRTERRLELARREDRVRVGETEVRVKVALLPDGTERPHPEDADVRCLAEREGLAPGEARRRAEAAWYRDR